LLHSETKSINVINGKIGIVKRFYTKDPWKGRINIRAISSNDLNNPLNPPFLRGTCNPRCPDRNVGKDKPPQGGNEGDYKIQYNPYY